MYFLFYPLGLNVRPKEFLLPLREIEDDGNVSSYALITKLSATLVIPSMVVIRIL